MSRVARPGLLLVAASGSSGSQSVDAGGTASFGGTVGGGGTTFDSTKPPCDIYAAEGAIGLGTGGDNSDGDDGNFYEGVMTAQFSSDDADAAVQANIVAFYSQAQ
jgi:hypothetical protein